MTTSRDTFGALREHPHGCTVAVRVQPGARKTGWLGLYDDGRQRAIKIALQAPPIDGRANEALTAYLAAQFGLARSSVELVSGETGRSKVVLLKGLDLGCALRVLDRLLG